LPGSIRVSNAAPPAQPVSSGASAVRLLTTIALLIGLAACMAVARLHTYDEPLEMDAATYAVIARELRAGRHLYSDLCDHKPPAVHATFAAAQMVAGSGPAHIYLLGLAAATVTLLGVYAAGSAIAGGQAACRRVSLR
jgi:hypothetical protein